MASKSSDTTATAALGVDSSGVSQGVKDAINSLSQYKSVVKDTAAQARLDPSSINAQRAAYESLQIETSKYQKAIDAIRAKQDEMTKNNPAAAQSAEYLRLGKQAQSYGTQITQTQSKIQKQGTAVAKAMAASNQPIESFDKGLQRIYRSAVKSADAAEAIGKVDLTTKANVDPMIAVLDKLSAKTTSTKAHLTSLEDAFSTAKFSPSNVSQQVEAYDRMNASLNKYKTAITELKTQQEAMLKSSPSAASSKQYIAAQDAVDKYSAHIAAAQSKIASQSQNVARAVTAAGQPLASYDNHVKQIASDGIRAATATDKLSRVKLSTLTNDSEKGAEKLGLLARASDATTSKVVRLGGAFKSMLAANVISNGISRVTSMISGSVDDAIKRVDTLNNATRSFENMGFSAGKTKKAMTDLDNAITGLPTSIDSAVRQTQLLAASTGDIDKSTKIYKAMNDGILGFGGSADMVENAVTQLSQAFSNGKVDAETWNSMINSGMGPALNALAKKMGITAGQLKTDLSSGKISVKDFQDALIDLDNKGGGGMKSLAQIAKDSTKGIGTSWTNFKTSITRTIAAVMDALAKAGLTDMIDKGTNAIKAAIPLVTRLSVAIAMKLATAVKATVQFFRDFWDTLNKTGAIDSVKTAIASLVFAFRNVVKAGTGGVPLLTILTNVTASTIKVVADVITLVARAIMSMDPATIRLIGFSIMGVVGALIALKATRSVVGTIQNISAGFSGLFGDAEKGSLGVKNAFLRLTKIKEPYAPKKTAKDMAALGSTAENVAPKMASFGQAMGAGLSSLAKLAGVSLVMVSAAYSVKLLSDSMTQLASLSWGQLAKGMVGMTVALSLLVAATAGLGMIGETFAIGVLAITPLIASIDGFVFALGYLTNALANAATVLPVFLRSIMPAFQVFYAEFSSMNWYQIFYTFAQSLLKGVLGALDAVNKYGPTLINRFVDVIVGMALAIGKNQYKLYNGLFDAIVLAVNGLNDAINRNYKRITNAGIGLVDTIAEAIGYGIGRAGFSGIGMHIVEGLWNGITDGWGKMLNHMGFLTALLPKKVRHILGIHSPSRVFAEIGGFVTAGFAKGIDEGASDVTASMTNVVKTLNSSASGIDDVSIVPVISTPVMGDDQLSSITDQIQAKLDSATFAVNVSALSGNAQASANNATNAQTTSPSTSSTSNSINITINQQPGQSAQSLVDMLTKQLNSQMA